MRIRIFTYLIIGSLSLMVSCDSKRGQIKFENLVLNQVFKELTDSLIYYPSFPPPPPPPRVDSLGRIDDTLNIVKYRKLVAQIDTTRKVISINDSTQIDEPLKEWTNMYQDYLETIEFNLSINDLIEHKTEKRKIEPNQIINNGKYELMKFSDLRKIQTKHPFLEYNFIYYGNMTLSRLYFNETYEKGFFTCEIDGRFFHYSFLILIENDAYKWTIKKMKRLSIE